MKHLPTEVLLDLAEDYLSLANPPENMPPHRYKELAMLKLAEIDAELLSRMPEGEFVTLYDYVHSEGDSFYGVEFLPVGFEPYIPDEDSDWLFDALYGHIEGVPAVDEYD